MVVDRGKTELLPSNNQYIPSKHASGFTVSPSTSRAVSRAASPCGNNYLSINTSSTNISQVGFNSRSRSPSPIQSRSSSMISRYALPPPAPTSTNIVLRPPPSIIKNDFRDAIDVDAIVDDDQENKDDEEEDDEEDGPSWYRRIMMILIMLCSTLVTWQSSSLAQFYGYQGLGLKAGSPEFEMATQFP